MKARKGFTLIELVVAVGAMALLVSTMVGLLFDSMKSSAKSKSLEKAEQEGTNILREIRRDLAEAKADSILCGPSGITYNSRVNGDDTSIRCVNAENRIASVSAKASKTYYLSSDGMVISCGSLISSCDLSGANPVVRINFSVVIGNSLDTSNYASKSFSDTVVIRN